MDIKTTVEIKIQKFVQNYGAEQLICWLDHFDTIINSKDYPLFRTLEKEACKSCGISLADMKCFSTTPCTNTRRIISFIAHYQLKLSVQSIAHLLNLSDRTVNLYIKDAEDWINAPKSNRTFIEAYNRVIENFKTE
jgi:hypothetical protein